MIKLHPYLNFKGNAEEAFNFYKSIFGGEFQAVVRFKDMPMPGSTLSKQDENKIMHISLPVGEQMLMASDTIGEWGNKFVVGTNNYITINPDSKAEADRIYNTLSKDGEVEMPIGDQPWGSYFASFKDKYRVCWMIDYAYPKG